LSTQSCSENDSGISASQSQKAESSEESENTTDNLAGIIIEELKKLQEQQKHLEKHIKISNTRREMDDLYFQMSLNEYYHK